MAHDDRKDSDDGGYRSPTRLSPDATDSKLKSNRTKAGLRASLACVQCRSKHVKCDATQPICDRCSVEGKPCYYPKSRRGIRDSKKRYSILDIPPIPTSRHSSATATKCASPIIQLNVSKNLSGGWTAPKPTDANTDGALISAFFEHFYHGHPILPPKRYFLKYVELDPSPYRFLLSVINLCGALYLEHPRLNDIREAAYSAACGPLPFTVQSIQGLHLLAIIAFGENQSMHHVSFATRSLEMAIELGMHRKFLADRAPDPVWAESYRRTWWYIKFQGMIRRVNSAEPTVDTYDIESDADLPCSEEWEYQSGDIPMPLSFMQYERELELGRSDFPSLAFQLEICRIQSDITRLCNQVSVGDEKRTELVNQMDLRICDFLRRIPRWKMDVVDPDGRPDQVIFGAVAWAHIGRIRLRQSILREGLNIREYFPLGPDRGPYQKGQMVKKFGWNPQPIDIQAANSVCDLFRLPFPVKNLRPMMVPGLLRVVVVYLDACIFLGLDSPIFRERIHALIRILRIHGETWPLSKKVAEDVQAVADEYLGPKCQFNAHADERNGGLPGVLDSVPFFETSGVGFDAYSFLDLQLDCMPPEYRESEQIACPMEFVFSAE